MESNRNKLVVLALNITAGARRLCRSENDIYCKGARTRICRTVGSPGK